MARPKLSIDLAAAQEVATSEYLSLGQNPGKLVMRCDQ